MEINNHPVLGIRPQGKIITIFFEGKALKAREGQTVASALMNNGVYLLGHSRNLSQARGLYCSNGRCQSCSMTIDGVEHVRSCVTLVKDKMTIRQSTGDSEVRRDSHEN